MAAAYYTKTMYSGVEDMAIWDGTNLDAILAVVLSAETADSVAYNGGELIVFGEKIEIGDGVCTATGGLERHAKIPRATLEADEWRVEALQFEGNHLAIMDFMGRNNCKIAGGVLYVNDLAIEDTDYTYKVMGRKAGKKSEAVFEAAYTAE